jgi:hypothetical protein
MEKLIRPFNQQRYISTKIIGSALSNCCASVITDSLKTGTQPGQAGIEDRRLKICGILSILIRRYHQKSKIQIIDK